MRAEASASSKSWRNAYPFLEGVAPASPLGLDPNNSLMIPRQSFASFSASSLTKDLSRDLRERWAEAQGFESGS